MGYRRQKVFAMSSRIALLAFSVGSLGLATAAAARVQVTGYAEYRLENALVVDGQRIVANSKTKLEAEGLNVKTLSQIPLGYEVKVDGERQPNGAILAKKVEAKPNGIAMFETDVLAATNQIERTWVREGAMYAEDERGRKKTIGDIIEDGPDVARVRRIMERLLPPYVSSDDIRVRVVDTKEWNASAMGNGAIWVYRGLLRELDDDELAIILGHELAHYTHEHSRRGAKSAMWGQLAGLAGIVGAGTVSNGTGRTAANLGALLSVSAWQSGYSRDLEDQADRVGLRYAHEGGFDVTKGPGLWKKFREKYGEQGSATTFFFGSHSRPSDRIRNLEREIKRNYPD
jgi:Zn-dependent protease with chaperone function